MERSGSILVVEDDAAMRELLSEELSDVGFSVQAAGSAAGGLEIARSARFDLVVTDLSFGSGTIHHANHGRPVCKSGNKPAHMTAKIVIASAARLMLTRHCWRVR